MKRKKKKIRKDKIKQQAVGETKRMSKYAAKVRRRRKHAEKLGLPSDTPYPVIWIYEQGV